MRRNGRIFGRTSGVLVVVALIISVISIILALTLRRIGFQFNGGDVLSFAGAGLGAALTFGLVMFHELHDARESLDRDARSISDCLDKLIESAKPIAPGWRRSPTYRAKVLSRFYLQMNVFLGLTDNKNRIAAIGGYELVSALEQVRLIAEPTLAILKPAFYGGVVTAESYDIPQTYSTARRSADQLRSECVQDAKKVLDGVLMQARHIF